MKIVLWCKIIQITFSKKTNEGQIKNLYSIYKCIFLNYNLKHYNCTLISKNNKTWKSDILSIFTKLVWKLISAKPSAFHRQTESLDIHRFLWIVNSGMSLCIFLNNKLHSNKKTVPLYSTPIGNCTCTLLQFETVPVHYFNNKLYLCTTLQ